MTPVQIASFFAGWSALTRQGKPSSEVVFEELAARRDGDQVGLFALYEGQWPAGATVTVPLQLVEEMLGAYRTWFERGNERRAAGA